MNPTLHLKNIHETVNLTSRIHMHLSLSTNIVFYRALLRLFWWFTSIQMNLLAVWSGGTLHGWHLDAAQPDFQWDYILSFRGVETVCMKDGCREVRGANLEFKLLCTWVRWVLTVSTKRSFEYPVCWTVDDASTGDMATWASIDARLRVTASARCCKLRSSDVGGLLLKRGLSVTTSGVFSEVKPCRTKES